DANLEYVGSITLDRRLMELSDIRENEQVAVLDINNGNRFETYAIEGGPGEVCLNGAAARLVQPGDKVIVITYADYEEAELEGYQPVDVHADEQNRPQLPSESRFDRPQAAEAGLRPATTSDARDRPHPAGPGEPIATRA